MADAEGGVRNIQLIVIGCSLGGMHALQTIFDVLPREFRVPMAVVQHRHKESRGALPAFFRRTAAIEIVDAEDKQPIRPGTAYLAPAGYHLLVERGTLHLSVDEPVFYSRPSIDVLFESAADAYGAAVAGVVLTGSNSDGARGSASIKGRGGFLVVQDPEDSEAPEMPRAAIAAARVDRILPLARLGPFLVELCGTPRG